MALGFIKKIFSFGKDDKGTATDTAAPAAGPTEAQHLDAAHHFPADSAPAFTPETSAEPELSIPEPVDIEHAGEPPVIPDDLVHRHQALTEKTEEIAEELREQATSIAEFEEATTEDEIPAPIASPEAVFEPEQAVPDVVESAEVLLAPAINDEPPTEPAAAPFIDNADDATPIVAPADETRATPTLPAGFASTADRPIVLAAEPERRLSWIERLRQGLSRTSAQLTSQITSLFTKRKLDDDTLQDLEDLLIQADLGVETALRITDTLASERYGKDVSGDDVSKIMASEIAKVLTPVAKPLELDLAHKPHVILVVGVNGTGKTTTIGKLAAKLTRSGLKVMLAAGDTFRAAAIEQLHIWANRTGADIVSSKLGADAAGLAYEAYEKAKQSGHDVLIIDTAGRLQNKTELMAELEKIVRVLGRLDPDAPHTVLQTLDATTGQNALNQVEIFRNVAGVSGLIMTKLDGTARGGILVAISARHKLPVCFIGVGEGIDDLEPFNAKDFAEAIAGLQNK